MKVDTRVPVRGGNCGRVKQKLGRGKMVQKQTMGIAPARTLQMRYQLHVLRLTNLHRSLRRIPPVQLNATLCHVAKLHNADLAFAQHRLNHVGRDGAMLRIRLARQGYMFRYASENLARGQMNCEWVINSWLKSEGHRRNLLNDRVEEMGLHVGRGSDGRLYWCQVFAKKRLR